MIHEEIVTYEVAKLAKEKGFDVPTAKNYRHENGTTCNAPTQSLLHRWLREKKGYYTWPFFNNEELRWSYIVEERRGDKWFSLILNTPNYDSYEEAMENALKFVLENYIY